jgi:hypothetical protein
MFDANAAKAKAEADYEPFSFVALDGTQHQLPHPLLLTERQWQRVRQGETLELLDDIAPEAAQAIGEMPAHLSRQLAQAWLSNDDSKAT